MSSTLLTAPYGTTVVLQAPRISATLRLRLAELGLRHGSTVRPVQGTPGGGRIIEVGTTRLALDRRTCTRLDVDSLDEAAH